MFFLTCTVVITLAAFLLFTPVSVALSRLVARRQVLSQGEEEADFACIITAYREAGIAFPLVESLLQQCYRNYTIYLVADACDGQELPEPREGLVILIPPAPLGSKTKSIEHAVNNFRRTHAAMLILDPDNLAHPNALAHLNRYFSAGYLAVQGQRTAKNSNTLYAKLDAVNELYYNYTVRQVPYTLGASSTLSGSGMAIATHLYRAHLASPEITRPAQVIIVAEDKILQAQLVEAGVQIAYCPEAVIYDEKVTSAGRAQRQRTRWLNAYFRSLPLGLKLLTRGVLRGNFNQFYFGFMTIQPPLFVLVLTTGLAAAILALAAPGGAILLAACGVVFSANCLWVLKLGNAPAHLWRALIGIPHFIGNQCLALLKVRKANKDFLVTVHDQHLTLDEVLHPPPPAQ